MANWSNPTLTSLYTDFLSELKARDTDLALQFDGTTSSNLATNTIRWNSSVNRWQKWSGTAWGELTSTYALTGLSTTGNATIGGTLGVTGAATLSGGGTSTTPATADNSTAIATTAYVKAQAYATLASPALTGTPTAPTAAADTNTTQLATTAYVLGQGSSTSPLMAGTAAAGTALKWARADHVHPTDTSRAPLASPTFTGTPAAPTAAVSTNTTQLATTAFVLAQIANDAPTKTGTGASGTWGISVTGNAGTATALQTARTINGVSFDGSANITVTASTTAALTAGSYLTSGGTFDGALARTFAVDATSANTASKVVARDASGNFSAGTITAALTGTASGNLALTGGTLSGVLQTTAGTAGAPGVGIGEATTGLFRPATGVLGFAVSGSESFRLTAAGGMSLGSTAASVNVGFRHSKAITGATTAWAQLLEGAVQTDVTTSAVGVASALGTAASTALTSLIHFQASTGTLGAGTTLTNQIGFSATSTLAGATNDYGFYGAIGAGTGNWNCYMVGAAPNYFAGQVQLDAGSVGTPALAANSDTNTGLYWPSADTLAIAAGGQLAVSFTPTYQYNPANIYIANTDDTAATSTTTLYDSSSLIFRGKYWNGTASADAEWSIFNDVTATTPTGTLRFRWQGNDKLTVSEAGTVTATTFVGALTGNASTATALATARLINGVPFNGAGDITIPATIANSVTFNNGGAGAASGTTFNGSAAVTVSYNTVGAPSTTGTNASGTWGISISGTAATATNANNLNLAAGTATTNYVLFAQAATGNQAIKTDSGLTYNASTNLLGASISGNAATATSLATGRVISLSGDVTGASGTTFNGTANVTIAATLSAGVVGTNELANAGVTAAKLSGAQSGSAPIYGARAWVNLDGNTTPAIRASGNITSVTRLGAGHWRFTFTTAMASANYAVVVSGAQALDSNDNTFAPHSLTTTTFNVISNTTMGGLSYEDARLVFAAVYL